MLKKFLLAGSAFLLAAAAYFTLSSGDTATSQVAREDSAESVRSFVSAPTTQGTMSIGDMNMPISPGDESRVEVFDENTQRLKYRFTAKQWRPVSDTGDYEIDDFLITLYMPRGEIAYISAKSAQATLTQKAKNRIEPQKGVLHGGVQVVIDRTTREWRRAHPELADTRSHPEDLIRIDMQDARFDMDRAELISDGAVVVDSREARIEDVNNLRVHWNQVDNRIETLEFAQGGKMTIRKNASMIQIGLPGEERKRPRAGKTDEPTTAPADDAVPLARANEPRKVEAKTTSEAAQEMRVEGARFLANTPMSIYGDDEEEPPEVDPTNTPLRGDSLLAEDMERMKREASTGLLDDSARKEPAGAVKPQGAAKTSKPKRINTYQAIFTNEVIVQQLQDGKEVGRLEADKLEVHFDFGSRQREMATRPEAMAANRPKAVKPPGIDDVATSQPAIKSPVDTPEASREDLASARSTVDEEADEKGSVILTWNGPLEMRPLFVPPDEQTGERKDVIATGEKVHVSSVNGNVHCKQLVYRGEREQIWIQGTEDTPCELVMIRPGDKPDAPPKGERRLSGVEIFFDRKRGLGRVDGLGSMRADSGALPGEGEGFSAVAAEEGPSKGSGVAADKAAGNGEEGPVEIRWSRGVDLELGLRPVLNFDQEQGVLVRKKKEYLRRAWFHGDVEFKRGMQRATAEEVAATFGRPPESEDSRDFLEHLNMTGDVEIETQTRHVEAERLDVQLIQTPDGRNVPRVVDAVGKVVAKQTTSEFRADVMHLLLVEVPGKPILEKDGTPKLAKDGKTPLKSKPEIAMESIDATGDVFLVDSKHNTKISKAETVNARIRGGVTLEKATIVSPSEDVFAQARFKQIAIHGHRIEMNMDDQTVDVPGPGKMWLVSNASFGGRKQEKPEAVRTTWKGLMQLRWEKNYAVFVDDVRSKSKEMVMNSDKLTVRFARAPARPVEGPKKPDSMWEEVLDKLSSLANQDDEIAFRQDIAINLTEKEPVYVVAQGNAEAISSKYAVGPDGKPGRLLNRLRIGGREIAADLKSEQLSVPCAGNLLLEDYKFGDEPGRRAERRTARVTSPLMGSARGDGPSQTLFEWDNAMDFFLDRALVSFDKNVRMLHVSGRQMVMRDELAEAFKLNPESLKKVGEGRRAELNCGNLLIEFVTPRGESVASREGGSSALVDNADLERLIARESVHLQDGTKSLMGEYLQYLRGTAEVRLEGGPGLDARIIDQEEAGGRFNMWRGPVLVWNRNTNAIASPKAAITTSGR